MPVTLAETLSQLEAISPSHDLDIEHARQTLITRLREAVERSTPEHIAALEQQHNWAESFYATLAAYERWGLFHGTPKKENPMSPRELRKTAPSAGHILDALEKQPDILAKVKQGFTRVHPVPIGLSPVSFKGPLGKAILHYKDAKTLRSTDGTKLKLDINEPVWIWDGYKNEELVYSPKKFDQKHHGGISKVELLNGSHPGWQVLLLEDLKDIPQEGHGQTVGSRPQIEAGKTPHQYLQLLQTSPYNLEHGLTPEAWQSLVLAHLTKTDGEFLDDYNSGSACWLPGAFFPSSGNVPYACWRRGSSQACVVGGVPGLSLAGSGLRSAVHVL